MINRFEPGLNQLRAISPGNPDAVVYLGVGRGYLDGLGVP